MELTGAYASFANEGTGELPYVVIRVKDDKGHVIYERKANDDRRVVGQGDVAHMNEMLNAVVTSGTGHAAQLPGRPVAGKTGTSSGYRDAWSWLHGGLCRWRMGWQRPANTDEVRDRRWSACRGLARDHGESA